MILTTNTPYPSRKIRRIRACTHQIPQRIQDQYAVSREDQYTVLEIWNEYNILEDIKRGPYSKTPQYAVSREDQYTVLEIWNEYNILEDIKRGPYSKTPQYAVSNPWIRRIELTSRPYK
ncbi:hypothetical protein Tco_0779470 [Tanacetum coccineum]